MPKSISFPRDPNNSRSKKPAIHLNQFARQSTRINLRDPPESLLRNPKFLVDRFGFSEDDITVLIDTDDSSTQPTGRNIRAALNDLVDSARPDDFLFVHYSGHGTRLPVETGEDDDTGYDECIVPTDMNLITDDDFRDLVDRVPNGCQITIVSDSCHSGGLIDEAKEQIGESTRNRFLLLNQIREERLVDRFNLYNQIPFESIGFNNREFIME